MVREVPFRVEVQWWSVVDEPALALKRRWMKEILYELVDGTHPIIIRDLQFFIDIYIYNSCQLQDLTSIHSISSRKPVFMLVKQCHVNHPHCDGKRSTHEKMVLGMLDPLKTTSTNRRCSWVACLKIWTKTTCTFLGVGDRGDPQGVGGCNHWNCWFWWLYIFFCFYFFWVWLSQWFRPFGPQELKCLIFFFFVLTCIYSPSNYILGYPMTWHITPYNII